MFEQFQRFDLNKDFSLDSQEASKYFALIPLLGKW